MVMNSITRKAKYLVIIMGILISVAMIFMGPPTDQTITMDREVSTLNEQPMPSKPNHDLKP